MKNRMTNSHFKDEYGNCDWDAQQRRIQDAIWERQAELRKIEMEAPQARIVDVDSPEGQAVLNRLQLFGHGPSKWYPRPDLNRCTRTENPIS